MIEQAKSTQVSSQVQFFLAWVIVTTIIFYVAELSAFYISRLSQIFSIDSFSPLPMLILALGVAIVGYLQQKLIQRFFGIQMQWWWLMTAAAYAVSITLQETMWSNFYSNESWTETNFFAAFLLSSVLRYGLIGLVQGWLLRPHLKYVGLYAGVFVFIGLIYTYIHLVEYFSIVIGILSGLILLWLRYVSDKHSDRSSPTISS